MFKEKKNMNYSIHLSHYSLIQVYNPYIHLFDKNFFEVETEMHCCHVKKIEVKINTKK